MNRTDRLTAIILLLQERSRTSTELASHFEVSRRTILRDVQALCEIGVPVIARDGAAGGYSLPEAYSIPPLRLTLRELAHLLLALDAIERQPDVPYPHERVSLAAKLRALIPRDRSAELEQLTRFLSHDVPERASRSPFVEQLLLHAQNGQWVRAEYRSLSGTSTPTLLPEHLSCRNGFWYCRAYAHEHRERRTYRVDRFLAVEPVPAPEGHPDLQPALPYDHPSHPEVVVRLSPRAAPEAEGIARLGAAVTRDEGGGGTWRFRCPPSELEWLTRFLLQLGPEARVDAPPELKAAVLQAAEKILESYSKR